MRKSGYGKAIPRNKPEKSGEQSCCLAGEKTVDSGGRQS